MRIVWGLYFLGLFTLFMGPASDPTPFLFWTVDPGLYYIYDLVVFGVVPIILMYGILIRKKWIVKVGVTFELYSFVSDVISTDHGVAKKVYSSSEAMWVYAGISFFVVFFVGMYIRHRKIFDR